MHTHDNLWRFFSYLILENPGIAHCHFNCLIDCSFYWYPSEYCGVQLRDYENDIMISDASRILEVGLKWARGF